MQYPLVTKKEPLLTGRRRRTLKRGCFAPDFLLFKSAVELMNKKEHLSMEGLRKIVSIRGAMYRGLTEVLINSFPGITP
jgi:hypothetical protein